MKKKHLSQRLGLLKEDGKPFLEYLRNLTPQILLVTFAALPLQKLETKPFGSIFLSSSLILIFLIAVVINARYLHQKCFSYVRRWGRRSGRIITRKKSGLIETVNAFLYIIYKRKLIEVIEYIVLFYVLTISFSVVIVMGSFSAASIIAARL